MTNIDLTGYKKWLWNKIKILIANTYYYTDYNLKSLDRNLLYPSLSVSMRNDLSTFS